MSMFLPSDVPPGRLDRYEMEAMLNYTTKPVIYVAPEFSGCVDIVKMAELVAGGEDKLRYKPSAACYITVTRGLVHIEEALRKIVTGD